MNLKIEYLLALFVVLFIILAINPQRVNNIYSSILGRLVLICVVIFFAMNNATLGLLVVLAIISASNQFVFFNFREGMDTIKPPVTIGEDNIPSTGKQIVLTGSASESKKRISDLKADISEGKNITNVINTTEGVDKEDIKNTVMPKDSKTIPVNKDLTSSSEDVSAHKPSMLNASPSLTEGYCPFAGNVSNF